jgi:hypothetical protein
MRYLEFKDKVRGFPIISSTHLFNLTRKPQTLKAQLTKWQKKGLIIKLKRGLYILNESDRKIEPSRIFLAYDLIPEKVVDVTSVTTKKTAKFTNPFGTFVYQHLKTILFFGFKEIEDENGLPVLIAEPEKAVLDFIYLNLQDFKNKDEDVFGLSCRFQNLDMLKKRKLINFAKKYENEEMLDVVENLLSFIKRER